MRGIYNTTNSQNHFRILIFFTKSEIDQIDQGNIVQGTLIIKKSRRLAITATISAVDDDRIIAIRRLVRAKNESFTTLYYNPMCKVPPILIVETKTQYMFYIAKNGQNIVDRLQKDYEGESLVLSYINPQSTVKIIQRD